MGKTRPKPRRLHVSVVLDTSVVYTGSSSYFVRTEVSDLINHQVDTADLTVRWIVPDIVRHERQFQMLHEARQLLPTVQKLERLLGHNLNITTDILDLRVKEAIDRQIEAHKIVVASLRAETVDWARLLLDAAYRRPPFQVGEKEKGFRDAVILETFLQIVDEAPATPAAARVVLVSGDQLLREAAQSRLESNSNIHLLDSIDALKGLLNTLGSTVDEHFIIEIRDKASSLFFKSKDETTLYFKARINDALEQTLREAKIQLPRSAEKYSVDKLTLSPPSFVRKQGQRIFWSTRVQARLKALMVLPRFDAHQDKLAS
jgi:PIN domain